MPENGKDDGNDLLTQIAVLTSLQSMLEDTIWEHILQARKEDISLRRIGRCAHISTTHLRRKLQEANAN
jgi:hypothetical protein